MGLFNKKVCSICKQPIKMGAMVYSARDKNGKILYEMCNHCRDCYVLATNNDKTFPLDVNKTIEIVNGAKNRGGTVERKMLCRTCNKVFAYTAKDIEKNREMEKSKNNAKVHAAFDLMFVSQITANQHRERAEMYDSKMVDLHKCPHCGSTDIVIAPNTNAESSKKEIVNTPNDAITEIERYKGLLDKGIITQEEFDAKKKQLLGL